MTLDRRTFLRWTAAAGVAVSTAPRWATRAHAADPFAGPYWLTIHAGGGWDPTLLCDPKGRVNDLDPDPVNMFFRDDIVEVGPFKAAPIDGHQAFFERFRNDLLVINGVDTQTNSHETGTRHTWSGSMDPGLPSLAALMAGGAETTPTLGYLSHGGYSETSGLVAPTRLPDTSAILEIAHPHRLDEDEADSLFLPPELLAKVQQARADRLDRLIADATLPRVKQSMGMLKAGPRRRQRARTPRRDPAGQPRRHEQQLDPPGRSLLGLFQGRRECEREPLDGWVRHPRQPRRQPHPAHPAGLGPP